MKLICSLVLIVSLTLGVKNKSKLPAKAQGYAINGYGKPLCPVNGCTYFTKWGVTCYRHSIDDYQPKDSVLWLPYKREMTFGY